MGVIITVINFAFRIYYMLILANIILSWLPQINRNNIVIRFIYEMTEPYLGLFRRILPVSPRFPLDFSPIIAIFVLYFVESLVFKILFMFAV